MRYIYTPPLTMGTKKSERIFGHFCHPLNPRIRHSPAPETAICERPRAADRKSDKFCQLLDTAVFATHTAARCSSAVLGKMETAEFRTFALTGFVTSVIFGIPPYSPLTRRLRALRWNGPTRPYGAMCACVD